MRLLGDIVAITFLTGLGVLLLLFPRRFQRVCVRAANWVPRWMLWPMIPAYYEGSYFVWAMRFVGAGCVIGALWVLSWRLAGD
jgi:hypothetical protein